ncbi:hypothetical protein TYRP_020033 [Tyrophagus putrescentiae]|nr:hypothetical protein TYRP_020033 [Tyrophagus putrescentiae]
MKKHVCFLNDLVAAGLYPFRRRWGGARRRLRLREGLPRPPSPHPKSHRRGADHQQGDDPASCRSSLWSN